MSKAIGGDYKGDVYISGRDDCLYIDTGSFLPGKKIFINKKTVAFYDVIDEKSNKSFSSGVVRGAVGAAVFGPLGGIAGAASAKNKSKYTVSVQFRDGRSSLLELDDRSYQLLVRSLY